MASFHERLEAEFENIEKAVSKLPQIESLPNLTELEIAGVAALIHSFYNGIENVLKQSVKEKKLPFPQGDSWHRDLIELATINRIISEETSQKLKKFIAFRHFFSHAYAFELDPERIVSLVKEAPEILKIIRSELAKL